MNYRSRLTFSELIAELKARGVDRATESRIRYAMRSGYVPRPDMNGSLRLEFTGPTIDALEQHLRQTDTRGRRPVTP
jgi:hypothetical protein